MTDRATVMIIDDNIDLAENLGEILEDEHIRSEVVSDGMTALTRLEGGGFDLVITDIRMPGMDGIQVLKAIHKRWPALPVIVMTAYSSDSSLEEAAASGALGVISKPIDIEQVIGLVRRVAEPSAPLLLIEDDRALRINLAEALLDLADVVPYTAPDLATARRLLAEIPFRVAIIDARLPDGDGLQFGGELRREFGDALQIIYITGYAGELGAELEDLLQTASIRLMEKPFSPARLMDLIRSVI
jgi:two-component system, NtrC family, response regulator HydG